MQYRVHADGGVYPQGTVDAYAALRWLAQGDRAGETRARTPSPPSGLFSHATHVALCPLPLFSQGHPCRVWTAENRQGQLRRGAERQSKTLEDPETLVNGGVQVEPSQRSPPGGHCRRGLCPHPPVRWRQAGRADVRGRGMHAAAAAAELGYCPERLVLMGDSAGGHLANAVCMTSAAYNGPTVLGQVRRVWSPEVEPHWAERSIKHRTGM